MKTLCKLNAIWEFHHFELIFGDHILSYKFLDTNLSDTTLRGQLSYKDEPNGISKRYGASKPKNKFAGRTSKSQNPGFSMIPLYDLHRGRTLDFGGFWRILERNQWF